MNWKLYFASPAFIIYLISIFRIVPFCVRNISSFRRLEHYRLLFQWYFLPPDSYFSFLFKIKVLAIGKQNLNIIVFFVWVVDGIRWEKLSIFIYKYIYEHLCRSVSRCVLELMLNYFFFYLFQLMFQVFFFFYFNL